MKISLFLLLLAISCMASEIPPTLISNPTFSNGTYFPSVVNIGPEGFGIVWQNYDRSVQMRAYPQDQLYTLNFSSGLTFFQAIGLMNQGFAVFSYNMTRCYIEGQIYDQNIQLLSIVNFTTYLDCGQGSTGVFLIPTTVGLIWVGGLGSLTNGLGLIGQVIFYNGTLGAGFDICDLGVGSWGPNAPSGLGLSNGSALIFWSGTQIPWTVMYNVYSAYGEALSTTRVVGELYNQQVVQLSEDEFVVDIWGYEPTAQFYVINSQGTVVREFTQPLGNGNGEGKSGPMVTLSNGNFVIMTNYYDEAGQNIIGLLGQVFNSTGPVTNQFMISGFSNIVYNLMGEPTNMVALPDGTFVVGFSGIGNSSNGTNQIFAQRMNSQGVPVELNPGKLSHFTVCDTKNLLCTNSKYRIKYIGGIK